MTTGSEYILEMNDITKSFSGVEVLKNVSLKVKSGTVHALMGENGAGKSTLMKCLFGIYKKDYGSIIHMGEEVEFNDAVGALEHKIAMIHQELKPEPNLTVMENIWLGRLPIKNHMVDSKKMYDDTNAILDMLNLKINPKALVKTLTVSEIQCIEVVKAVSRDANLIIMDEPTSSLTEGEVEHLFQIIEDLKKSNVAIIYISHKMKEILQISDYVSVMRDGSMIGTWQAEELTTDKIISKMVGRDMKNLFPPITHTPQEVMMRVEDFTSAYPKSFKDITFELKKGEVLGFAGLVGAQRTELMESIYGLRSISSGTITINGKQVVIKSSSDANNNGIALLTEDRKKTGIFPELSVNENIVLPIYRRFSGKIGYIKQEKFNKMALEQKKCLNIKAADMNMHIKSLSGGNQQKALLSRWLLTDPDIFLLDEPTRGIDVSAKYEIYSLINELAAAGKSIIVVSSEMIELLGISDRIIVMCEGKISGEFNTSEIGEEEIMQAAVKFMC